MQNTPRCNEYYFNTPYIQYRRVYLLCSILNRHTYNFPGFVHYLIFIQGMGAKFSLDLVRRLHIVIREDMVTL